jgi:glycosyltransferase involved in cell wall biosynthesis
MKRALIISCGGIPSPLNGASTVVFFQYINALLADDWNIEHKIFASQTSENQREIDIYRQAVFKREHLKLECIWEQPKVSFSVFGFWTSLSLQPCGQFKEDEPPRFDAIICFDTLALAIAKKLQLTPRITWLGDLQFQTVFYHALYDVKSNPFFLFKCFRSIFRSLGWRQIYKNLLRGEKFVIASSFSSERILRSIGIDAKYQAFPWPETGFRDEQNERPKIPTFIFFGNLTALGSKSAFYFLMKKVYPLMIKEWGSMGFQIIITGTRVAPKWVRKVLSRFPELDLRGFIEDLFSVVNQCHAVLVPIDVPVGNRTRIITAMSFKAVVIAHVNTSLGNPELRSNENCLLAESGIDFFNAMRLVVADSSVSKRIGCMARSTYESCFSPPTATIRFLETVETVRSENGLSVGLNL